MRVIRTGLVRISVITAAVAVLALLGSCKNEAAISAATGHKTDIDRDGNTVTIQSDEGAMKFSGGDNVSLPANFPKDVYLPTQYKVRSVMDMGSKLTAIQLSTGGDAGVLYGAARNAMKQQGWEEEMAMQSEGGRMAAFEKGERMATLAFNEQQGEVQVSVQLHGALQ